MLSAQDASDFSDNCLLKGKTVFGVASSHQASF